MTFELKIISHRWITDTDDGSDTCSHGDVHVQIGDEIISTEATLNLTTSVASLNLLRTLKSDYINNDSYYSQLIPCCAHFLIYTDDETPLVAMNCNVGLDWEITHLPNGLVRHKSAQGSEAIISLKSYQQIVFSFCDEVEAFYARSKPRIISGDGYDGLAYHAFWKQWRTLRDAG